MTERSGIVIVHTNVWTKRAEDGSAGRRLC